MTVGSTFPSLCQPPPIVCEALSPSSPPAALAKKALALELRARGEVSAFGFLPLP